MHLIHKSEVDGMKIEVVSGYDDRYTTANNNILVIDMESDPIAVCYVASSCKKCPLYLQKFNSCKATSEHIHTLLEKDLGISKQSHPEYFI